MGAWGGETGAGSAASGPPGPDPRCPHSHLTLFVGKTPREEGREKGAFRKIESVSCDTNPQGSNLEPSEALEELRDDLRRHRALLFPVGRRLAGLSASSPAPTGPSVHLVGRSWA